MNLIQVEKQLSGLGYKEMRGRWRKAGSDKRYSINTSSVREEVLIGKDWKWSRTIPFMKFDLTT
jgi:hypothetical protein